MWSSAGQGGKRGEKKWYGEILCKWMKDLTKQQMHGKKATVSSVAEGKERLGLTEQGKL